MLNILFNIILKGGFWTLSLSMGLKSLKNISSTSPWMVCFDHYGQHHQGSLILSSPKTKIMNKTNYVYYCTAVQVGFPFKDFRESLSKSSRIEKALGFTKLISLFWKTRKQNNVPGISAFYALFHQLWKYIHRSTL